MYCLEEPQHLVRCLECSVTGCVPNKNKNDFRFSVAATNSKIDLTEYKRF